MFLTITKFEFILLLILYIISVFIDTYETDPKKVENQMVSVKIDPEIETTNDLAGHWLDSMLDSDE